MLAVLNPPGPQRQKGRPLDERLAPADTLYCSWCGKSQHEVKKLIAGPTVFICDECVDLCVRVLRGEVVVGEQGRGGADIRIRLRAP
jgi:hypothetical protein